MQGLVKTTSIINAAYPRSHPNSTLSPTDQLQIVYDKFQSTRKSTNGQPKVNLLFAHGNGMNRNIWKYYVEEIFKSSQNSEVYPFQINKIITFDSINHGDSALLNEYKLGVSFQWLDNAKDIIEIIKAEKLSLNAKLILIGHSFGGCSTLMCDLFAPNLVDSVIAIDPVIFDVEFKSSSSHRETPSQMKNSLNKLSRGLEIFRKNYKSKDEIYSAFAQSPIFANFDQQILKDMIGGEIVSNNNNIIKLKTTYEQQMIIFASSTFTIKLFKLMASGLDNKVLFLVGKDSTFFNFRKFESIKKDNMTLNILPKGGHLVHCEFPDMCIEKIMSFITERFTNPDDSQFEKIKNSINENAAILESLSEKHRQENFDLMYKDLMNHGFEDMVFISDIPLKVKL